MICPSNNMSKGIWVSGRFLGLGSSYWSQLPLWWKLTRHSSRVGDLNLLFLCDKAADKKNQRNSVGNQEVTCFQLQKEQYIYIYYTVKRCNIHPDACNAAPSNGQTHDDKSVGPGSFFKQARPRQLMRSFQAHYVQRLGQVSVFQSRCLDPQW